jgi:hypothetical protein
MTRQICIICDSQDFKVVCEYDHPDIYEEAVGVSAQDYWRRWVKCKNCGFHASHYSRNKDILDSIYEKKYREKALPSRGATTEEIFHKINALPPEQSETVQRISWIKSSINKLVEAEILNCQDNPLRLLDIGGATAIFAHEFQDDKWRSHVVDLAEDGKFIETSLGIPFMQSSYQAGLFANKFHLISLLFVLEHLHSPEKILQIISDDLVDSGLLYIEVPDYVAFKLKPLEDDIFNSCHLWMFDPGNLTRMLTRNGFEIMYLTRTKTVRGHYALSVLAGRS